MLLFFFCKSIIECGLKFTCEILSKTHRNQADPLVLFDAIFQRCLSFLFCQQIQINGGKKFNMNQIEWWIEFQLPVGDTLESKFADNRSRNNRNCWKLFFNCKTFLKFETYMTSIVFVRAAICAESGCDFLLKFYMNILLSIYTIQSYLSTYSSVSVLYKNSKNSGETWSKSLITLWLNANGSKLSEDASIHVWSLEI